MTSDKVGNLLYYLGERAGGTFTKLTSTTYTYDAHNRRITEKTGKSGDSGGGGITTAYNYRSGRQPHPHERSRQQ